MKLNDLQNEYTDFYTYFNFSHSLIYELTNNLNIYLNFYNKIKNHDINLALRLEENLLYFEYILQEMDNMSDIINNLDFSSLKLPDKIRKIKKRKKRINICYVDNYDDIYVDSKACLDYKNV